MKYLILSAIAANIIALLMKRFEKNIRTNHPDILETKTIDKHMDFLLNLMLGLLMFFNYIELTSQSYKTIHPLLPISNIITTIIGSKIIYDKIDKMKEIVVYTYMIESAKKPQKIFKAPWIKVLEKDASYLDKICNYYIAKDMNELLKRKIEELKGGKQ